MKRKAPGSTALAIAILLVACPVAGFSRGVSPSVRLTVVADPLSDKLVCTASPILLPVSRSSIVVSFALPPNSTLTSAVLITTSGQLALDVPTTSLWPTSYDTLIDCKKAKCASSGNLVLAVEGELEPSSVSCPQIPLFKTGACDECTSAKK